MKITINSLSKPLETGLKVVSLLCLVLLFQNCAGQHQSTLSSDVSPGQPVGKLENLNGKVTYEMDGCGLSVCTAERECFMLSGTATDGPLVQDQSIQVSGDVFEVNNTEPSACMGMVNKRIVVRDLQIL